MTRVSTPVRDTARTKLCKPLTVRTESDDVDRGGVPVERREVFDAWWPWRGCLGRALDQGGWEDVRVDHP